MIDRQNLDQCRPDGIDIDALDFEKLDFEKLDGLLPAVIQESRTRQVLMVGFMNREALEITIAERRIAFFSRSRRRIWRKGESSGNVLHLESIALDCDNDALLIRARPEGPTCHSGAWSCFGERSPADPLAALTRLEAIVASRQATRPDGSYTASLLTSGVARIAQKVGEEGVEVVIAALNGERAALVGEAADLLYHLVVLLAARDLSLADVAAVLERRMPSEQHVT